MANLLERQNWDYVLGSVHFLGEFAVDFDDETDIWRHESTAERICGSATSTRSPSPR